MNIFTWINSLDRTKRWMLTGMLFLLLLLVATTAVVFHRHEWLIGTMLVVCDLEIIVPLVYVCREDNRCF